MFLNQIFEGLRNPKDNPCWKGYHPVGTKQKDGRTVPNCVPNANEGVAEGILGDREYNRVMPFVKRIAGEVNDYERDEFGEELWSLLDQKYGSKFAQSVLQDALDFYWNEYTALTGPGLDEASVYKKDQDLSSVSTQELEAFVKKHWGGGIPTWGQGESVKRAIRELRRRQKQGVAEGLDNDFEQSHHNEVEKYITTHGTPGEYRHKYDAMGRAHNSYLTYPGRTVTINTQQYGDRFGHNVFTKKEGVAEGPGFDKWADERAASQIHKLKNPYHPKTWHDVDPKLGKAVDKMSQAEKVKKGFAHPDTLKKGVAEGDVVQFPKKHKSDLENTHSCVKCGGDLQGGTYMGHKVKVCMPCKQVYLPPNTGIDQRGNKVDEQGVAEAIPYALSAANANAEFERTKTHVPQGYRGRVDAEVSSREEYQDVMIALKKAAQEEGQHVECGLSGNQMSIFSKTMDSDELDEFVDNVLSDGLTEGKMSEVDQIIRDIVSGDMDAYTVMTRPQSDTEQHVAQILEREYEEVARSHRLHPDDDFEQILDIVVDNLAQDYGVSELDEAQPEKIAGRYEPDEFDQMVLRLKQKAKEQERKHGPVDLNALAKRLRGIEQDGRTTKGS